MLFPRVRGEVDGEEHGVRHAVGPDHHRDVVIEYLLVRANPSHPIPESVLVDVVEEEVRLGCHPKPESMGLREGVMQGQRKFEVLDPELSSFNLLAATHFAKL